MNPLLNPNNHLFNLARSGRRLPHLLVVTPLSFIFVLVAAFGGGIIAIIINILFSLASGALSPESVDLSSPAGLNELILPKNAWQQTTFLVFSFGPIFLILWGWLALVEKRSLWTIGMERLGAWQKYVRGLVVGFLMFAASIAILAAFGYMAWETGNPRQQGLAALGGVLLVFIGWTVQGPAEEALTRGWLMPVIGARYSPLLGVLVSSVIFAVFHALNFIGLEMNPLFVGVALLNLFLFGLFAALYALYEGSMWGIFSIHAVWNWAQGNVFGLQVSGGGAPGGTLFNLMEVGPDLMTGGPFGPEGGLAVTLVLLVSCGLVWWASQRRPEEA